MKVNPLAILLIIFTTCVGWLGFGQDLPAAIGGLATGVGLVIVGSLLL